jgi:hypothetical protein
MTTTPAAPDTTWETTLTKMRQAAERMTRAMADLYDAWDLDVVPPDYFSPQEYPFQLSLDEQVAESWQFVDAIVAAEHTTEGDT